MVASVLISCATSDRQRQATDQSAGSQPGPAVEEYLDILLPGLAAETELDQLDPGRYSSLVSRFREGGLEGLSESDRTELLRVAQVAFLSHAETARYEVTSRDRSPDTRQSHEGAATIEEVYVPRTLSGNSPTGSTVYHLGARRTNTDGICWSWGLEPYWDAECRGELRLFVEFVWGEQYPEGATAIITEWSNADGQWTCYRTDAASGYRYYAAALDHWGGFMRFAKGTPTGRDILDGQATYRFDLGPIQCWLDAETLWLRQYEFEDPNGALITVKLEAINGDIRIEPPDVGVECVEEDASE